MKIKKIQMKIKNEKGVTMVSLVVIVMVMLLLAGVLMYNVKGTNDVTRLTNMQSDIENLREKVTDYYLTTGEVPTITKNGLNELVNNKLKSNAQDNPIGANDTENQFYILDLKQLEGLTLNFGRDYEKIKEETVLSISANEDDIYIINKDSHNIFYLKGIKVDNHTYFTKQEKDKDSVILVNN